MDTLSTEILCDEKANGRKNKTRKSKKARVKDEGWSLDQNNIDTQLMNNSTEGNVFVDKLIKDEVQSSGQTKMATRSMKKLAEGNATIEKPKDKDEHQFFCQRKADIGSSENLTEVSVATENPELLDEYQSNIDTGSTKSIAEGTGTGKRTKKRRKRTARSEIGASVQCELNARILAEENLTTKKSKIKDEVQKTGPTETDFGNLKLQDETQSMCHTDLDNEKAQSIITKRKTKKANMTNEKLNFKDALRTLGQTQMDAGSTENLADGKVIMENSKTLDEAQSMDQNSMDIWQLAENLAQGDVVGKRIKKRKNKKAKVNDEFHSEMDTRPENLAEGVANLNKPEIKDAVRSVAQTEMDTGSTDSVAERNVTINNPKVQDEIWSIDHTEKDTRNLAEGNVMVKRIKKRTKTKKAKVKDELLGRMEAGSTEINAEVNVNVRILETRNEVPSVALTQMDIGSTDNVAEENVIIEDPKDQDEFESIDQMKMDIGTTQSLDEGNVTVKRKKKGKKTKKAEVDVEFSNRMDAGPTEKLAKVNVNIKVPETRDEVPNVGLTQIDTGSTDNVVEGNVTIENLKDQDEFRIIDQEKVVTGPTQNLAERNVTAKREKMRKKTKKAKVQDEFSGSMDAGATANLAEVNANVRIPETRDEVPNMGLTQMDTGSTDNVAEGIVTIENPKDQNEFQIIDQAKVDTGPTQHLAEGNVTAKREKRRKKTKKAKVQDEFSSSMDAGATANLAEVNANVRIPETRDEVHNVGLTQIDTGSTDNVTIENLKDQDEFQIVDPAKVDSGPTQNLAEGNVTVKRKKRRKKTKKAKVKDEFSGRMVAGSTENLDEGKGHAEGRSAIPTCNAFTVKDAEILCLKTAPIVSFRKKLIVLDINGLLADVVFPAPKHYTGDIKVFGRAVFRRPFCDDFLKFCFQNFNVGIWSSRSKKIIDKVVSYLLGDQKDKLLFCWDMTHCTKTGFNTLENRHKPLVCKELRKIWEKDDLSFPWKKGDFNESNTLLLDDSPYKALLNPLHTTISPHPYQYSDSNDNSLGPRGDLRVYLEGVAASENVQKYVEQHPFGQCPIGEQDLSWEFYERVLQQMSNDKTSQSIVS